MLVKVAWPDTVYDVPMVTVALVTVSVVEMGVAALAMAPARIARAQVFMIRVIEVSSGMYTPENTTEQLNGRWRFVRNFTLSLAQAAIHR
jgi:hypothetical protein